MSVAMWGLEISFQVGSARNDSWTSMMMSAVFVMCSDYGSGLCCVEGRLGQVPEQSRHPIEAPSSFAEIGNLFEISAARANKKTGSH